MPTEPGVRGDLPDPLPAPPQDPEERPRVTVLVRAECRTCDRVQAVVREVCWRVGEPWEVVDVDAPDTDPEVRAEFSDAVPVTLVDGVEVGSVTLDPAALDRALTGPGGTA